jgi:hypothetical protein
MVLDGMSSIVFHSIPFIFCKSKQWNLIIYHFIPFHSIQYHQSKHSLGVSVKITSVRSCLILHAVCFWWCVFDLQYGIHLVGVEVLLASVVATTWLTHLLYRPLMLTRLVVRLCLYIKFVVDVFDLCLQICWDLQVSRFKDFLHRVNVVLLFLLVSWFFQRLFSSKESLFIVNVCCRELMVCGHVSV